MSLPGGLLLRGRDVVIVGVGRVGRLVAEDMRQESTITVIDVDPARLSLVPDNIGRIPVLKLLGDATSRLVLQKADLDLHTVRIVVTGDDAVNREVARLAREHYGTEEIVTLVDNTDGLDDAGLTATDIIQRYRGTAALVLSHVSAGTTRGVALGLGLGEFLQVRVMEGSAAIGRASAALSARSLTKKTPSPRRHPLRKPSRPGSGCGGRTARPGARRQPATRPRPSAERRAAEGAALARGL